MAERRLKFWAICGVTLISRNSMTKSVASKPLSPPRVIASGLSARGLDHLERRQPFSMTGDAGQSGVDDEPVAVLHQGVTDEAEPGFHTWPCAIEHGIGVAE